MFLDGTQQFCDEQGVIVPWLYTEHVIDEWNKVAHQLKFRTYQDKGNRYASRKRLSEIIQANAALLGGSKRTSKSVLTHRFLEKFILACDYLKKNCNNDDSALDILGGNYQKTMGLWQWLRPDLKAIVYLSGLELGEPDALTQLNSDKLRRLAKAKALKGLEMQWQETVKKCAYLLKTADDIKLLEPAVAKALGAIESEIEFLANP